MKILKVFNVVLFSLTTMSIAFKPHYSNKNYESDSHSENKNHHNINSLQRSSNSDLNFKNNDKESISSMIKNQENIDNINHNTSKVVIDNWDENNMLSYSYDVIYGGYTKEGVYKNNFKYVASGYTKQDYALGQDNNDIKGNNISYVATSDITNLKIHLNYNYQPIAKLQINPKYLDLIKLNSLYSYQNASKIWYSIDATGILTDPKVVMYQHIIKNGKEDKIEVGTFGVYNFYQTNGDWAISLMSFLAPPIMLKFAFSFGSLFTIGIANGILLGNKMLEFFNEYEIGVDVLEKDNNIYHNDNKYLNDDDEYVPSKDLKNDKSDSQYIAHNHEQNNSHNLIFDLNNDEHDVQDKAILPVNNIDFNPIIESTTIDVQFGWEFREESLLRMERDNSQTKITKPTNSKSSTTNNTDLTKNDDDKEIDTDKNQVVPISTWESGATPNPAISSRRIILQEGTKNLASTIMSNIETVFDQESYLNFVIFHNENEGQKFTYIYYNLQSSRAITNSVCEADWAEHIHFLSHTTTDFSRGIFLVYCDDALLCEKCQSDIKIHIDKDNSLRNRLKIVHDYDSKSIDEILKTQERITNMDKKLKLCVNEIFTIWHSNYVKSTIGDDVKNTFVDANQTLDENYKDGASNINDDTSNDSESSNDEIEDNKIFMDIIKEMVLDEKTNTIGDGFDHYTPSDWRAIFAEKGLSAELVSKIEDFEALMLNIVTGSKSIVNSNRNIINSIKLLLENNLFEFSSINPKVQRSYDQIMIIVSDIKQELENKKQLFELIQTKQSLRHQYVSEGEVSDDSKIAIIDNELAKIKNKYIYLDRNNSSFKLSFFSNNVPLGFMFQKQLKETMSYLNLISIIMKYNMFEQINELIGICDVARNTLNLKFSNGVMELVDDNSYLKKMMESGPLKKKIDSFREKLDFRLNSPKNIYKHILLVKAQEIHESTTKLLNELGEMHSKISECNTLCVAYINDIDKINSDIDELLNVSDGEKDFVTGKNFPSLYYDNIGEDISDVNERMKSIRPAYEKFLTFDKNEPHLKISVQTLSDSEYKIPPPTVLNEELYIIASESNMTEFVDQLSYFAFNSNKELRLSFVSVNDENDEFKNRFLNQYYSQSRITSRDALLWHSTRAIFEINEFYLESQKTLELLNQKFLQNDDSLTSTMTNSTRLHDSKNNIGEDNQASAKIDRRKSQKTPAKNSSAKSNVVVIRECHSPLLVDLNGKLPSNLTRAELKIIRDFNDALNNTISARNLLLRRINGAFTEFQRVHGSFVEAKDVLIRAKSTLISRIENYKKIKCEYEKAIELSLSDIKKEREKLAELEKERKAIIQSHQHETGYRYLVMLEDNFVGGIEALRQEKSITQNESELCNITPQLLLNNSTYSTFSTTLLLSESSSLDTLDQNGLWTILDKPNHSTNYTQELDDNDEISTKDQPVDDTNEQNNYNLEELYSPSSDKSHSSGDNNSLNDSESTDTSSTSSESSEIDLAIENLEMNLQFTRYYMYSYSKQLKLINHSIIECKTLIANAQKSVNSLKNSLFAATRMHLGELSDIIAWREEYSKNIERFILSNESHSEKILSYITRLNNENMCENSIFSEQYSKDQCYSMLKLQRDRFKLKIKNNDLKRWHLINIEEYNEDLKKICDNNFRIITSESAAVFKFHLIDMTIIMEKQNNDIIEFLKSF